MTTPAVEPVPSLTENTRINLPVSLAWAALISSVLVAASAAGLYIDAKYAWTGLKKDVDEKLGIAVMAEMQLRSAIANPGTAFSDPRAPSQMIVVQPGRASPLSQSGQTAPSASR